MPTLDRWRQLQARLGAPASDDALFARLIACHGEPHRSYHTAHHLDECLDRLDGVRDEAAHPDEVEFALWFHDAVYDTRRHDNEAKSADWARAAAIGMHLPPAVPERIHRLVMVTRHDAEPEGPDEEVMIDVDLGILAAPSERFDEYERQVRSEYSWVPDDVFRIRRRELLTAFLSRPSIFHTRSFAHACEARARANLERSIARLAG